KWGSLQKLRRHIPALAIVGDDADRFLVVARDHSSDRGPPVGMKGDPFADTKLEHGRMRSELSQELEAGDNAVIEVDQLGLGQQVDVDRHCRLLSLSLPSSDVFPER